MVDGLVLDNLTLKLHSKLIAAISRRIAPGEILTIMGASGTGKSSLLSCIAGLTHTPFSSSGRIILDGTDLTSLPPNKRRLGLMFQAPLLFPHLSVRDNLLFGLAEDGSARAQRRQAAEQALREVGMEGFGDTDPATLSGGQQTRVALMRMLLSKPAALLLDEPFSSLDQALRQETRELVLTMARTRQLPVLLVTHDPADAEAAGGEVLTLSGSLPS